MHYSIVHIKCNIHSGLYKPQITKLKSLKISNERSVTVDFIFSFWVILFFCTRFIVLFEAWVMKCYDCDSKCRHNAWVHWEYFHCWICTLVYIFHKNCIRAIFYLSFFTIKNSFIHTILIKMFEFNENFPMIEHIHFLHSFCLSLSSHLYFHRHASGSKRDQQQGHAFWA